MNIAFDLRCPSVRAKEIANSICIDYDRPDIIFFQETFNEDATKILCESLQLLYPYIIHSVAPQICGYK